MYNPGSVKYLSYQISNPNDSGWNSYYVQVIVRYSNGLSQIAKVNLTSKGNGLYTGSYPIPQSDPNGLTGNFDLFETLSVYTDSAYSTLSPNYSIVNTPVEVGFVATNAAMLNGGGGFDMTDYKFIRKLIKEELAAFLELIPKQKEFKFSTENLEKMIMELLQRPDNKEFLANELKAHREDIARGFEGMNNNVLGINDSISKIPLNKVVEILGTQTGELGKGLIELHKKHDKLSGNFESLQTAHQDSLKELSEENKAVAGKILQQVNDTMADYFASIHTMVIDKERGVPRIERKPETPAKPDYLKLASSFIRQPKNA